MIQEGNQAMNARDVIWDFVLHTDFIFNTK